MNSHLIIGTAGHVDHGKTAFIRHLTGIETDRLRDEQERGITIENGYAHLTLTNQVTVGFIDVPGHERFIRTMLSGATSMDAVILIISAEEGIKPQTVEHFNIIKHLDIQKGILLITKCDLVSETALSTLEGELTTFAKDSIFEGMPILRYSIYDEACKEAVVDILTKWSMHETPDKSTVASRLYIDRVFTVKGFGTVVTGTLLEGKIKKNDQMMLYPSGQSVRVKGIQVYGKPSEVAEYGQRTALNLSIDHQLVQKGDLITSMVAFEPTMIIEATFNADELDTPIVHWQRLKLHHGTREILCRIAIGTENRVESHSQSTIQLRLEAPLYAKPNDAYILRSFSPMKTLGGGKIVRVHPPKRAIHDITDASNTDFTEVMDVISRLPLFFTLNDHFYSQLSLTVSEVDQTIQLLTQHGDLVILDQKIIKFETLERISDLIIEELQREHKAFPLRVGCPRETLRSRTNSRIKPLVLDKSDFNALLSRLVQLNLIKETNGVISEVHFKVDYTPEMKTVMDRIYRIIDEHSQQLVPINDIFNLGNNKNLTKEMLYHLINREILVRINEETIMRATLYLQCKEALVAYFENHDELTVADYRNLIGFSRKGTVLLLEHFDGIALTKRNENSRTLIKK